jgi:GTP-binding protein
MASGFVDEARIAVQAGDGGGGAVSFQRTKFQPRGGPDGGNGGKGGSVVVVAAPDVGTLASYARTRQYKAASGTKGGVNNRAGSDAADLELRVPVGTLVRDATTNEVLADLAKPGVRFVAARGGRAGRGNAAMKSSQDRVPNYAEQGEPGEQAEIALEVRIVADVGLIGPPNAGKSTLLGAISAAHPKVADYPFTTLEPALGVVEGDGERFVVADLPGLIEGASEGRGLGLRFLRHATRCRALVVVVDLTASDPVADLEAVAGEVETYDSSLSERLSVVVGNKIDLDGADVAGTQHWASDRRAEFVALSAMQRQNTDELVRILAELVTASRATQPEPESFAVFRPVREDRIVVTREGTGFRVSSERVERLVAQTPLGNARAVRRLQLRLRSMGVEKALAKEGAKEGDDIYVGGVTFEFFPEDSRSGPEDARA